MDTDKKTVDEGAPDSGGDEPKATDTVSMPKGKSKRSKEEAPLSSSLSTKTPKTLKAPKAKKAKTAKEAKTAKGGKGAEMTVHKAKKDQGKTSKTKTAKKSKQTEKPSSASKSKVAPPPSSSAASSPSLTASNAAPASAAAALTARTGITGSPKVLPVLSEAAAFANHPEAHSKALQAQMALAEWQHQNAAAAGGSLRGGGPSHPFARAAASSGRPQDTKELLALAGVADSDYGSMQHLLAARAASMGGGGLRHQEMMEHEMALAAAAANRNHIEHLLAQEMALQNRVRMEQELMTAAHQQQAHHHAQSIHNMAVNALVSGVSVEEIMVRSGLPRDLSLEVARRMIALSQASAGGLSQGGHSLAAAAAARNAEAQNDSLTMAMIREQTILQQQQLQDAAFRLRGGALP